MNPTSVNPRTISWAVCSFSAVEDAFMYLPKSMIGMRKVTYAVFVSQTFGEYVRGVADTSATVASVLVVCHLPLRSDRDIDRGTRVETTGIRRNDGKTKYDVGLDSIFAPNILGTGRVVLGEVD
ncbi:hypothetical protein NUW54_g5946 [Trametes sanguinea]|uniref:Uncharacterized protein n=1 Tax=Trametes sanguinea TaxID=158606 RepID=A0ACC1PTP7_9APHY|nr:hypothetical protein NUW54_g5946 [Trametes sanguinea]